MIWKYKLGRCVTTLQIIKKKKKEKVKQFYHTVRTTGNNRDKNKNIYCR